MRLLSFLLLLSMFLLEACKGTVPRMDGFEVHGIDVSHHQGPINWERVKEEDIHFAFIKASEGMNFMDDRFQENWKQMKEQKISRGAYHFYRPLRDPMLQFENYRKQVHLIQGDLPPVLDVEVTDDESFETVVSGIGIWLRSAEEHYGVKPIIYTNQKFFTHYIKGNFDDYPIWIAAYRREPIELPGKAWTFWQYTNRGMVSGIEGMVDLNVFRGNKASFDAFKVQEKPQLVPDVSDLN